jgi:hypothetical protein
MIGEVHIHMHNSNKSKGCPPIQLPEVERQESRAFADTIMALRKV